MASMTPEEKVIDYLRWCEAAYGAPAPDDEIKSQLSEQHGLNESQSDDMLASMKADGRIAYHDGEFFDGWHAPSPKTN